MFYYNFTVLGKSRFHEFDTSIFEVCQNMELELEKNNYSTGRVLRNYVIVLEPLLLEFYNYDLNYDDS